MTDQLRPGNTASVAKKRHAIRFEGRGLAHGVSTVWRGTYLWAEHTELYLHDVTDVNYVAVVKVSISSQTKLVCQAT